jgi:DNA (cytosine-5)-methyltransferase 1
MSTLYEGNRVGDPRVYKDIAPTITARYGTGGNNVPLLLDDEHFVRKLTPVECERLQGFPDNWTDGQSTADRYKQIGNAVTVNIAEWIGKRL